MNVTQFVLATYKLLEKNKEKRFTELIDEYKNHHETFLHPFLEAVDSVLLQGIEKQNCNQKGRVKYISFSFLYSNLFMNKYALRIDLFDDDFLFDEQHVVGEWKIDCFFKDCESDFEKVMKMASSNYIKINAYEKKELYRSYIYDFFSIVFVSLKDFVPKIVELDSFKRIQKADEVILTLGEYMDKVEEIYRIDCRKEGMN